MWVGVGCDVVYFGGCDGFGDNGGCCGVIFSRGFLCDCFGVVY